MGFFDALVDGANSLVGGKQKEEKATNASGTSITIGNAVTRGTTSEQLKLDPLAIQKIISDVLGAEQGLAAILGADNISGIYDSTVAQEAASNFTANLIGEIAKITGETVGTSDETVSSQEQTVSQESSSSATNTSDDGLIKTALGLGNRSTPNPQDPIEDLLLPDSILNLEDNLTPDFVTDITDRIEAIEKQSEAAARDALPSSITDLEKEADDFESEIEMQANTAVAEFLNL